MRCPNCGGAELINTIVPEYDIGRVVGLTSAIMTNASILKCPSCGAATVDGALIDFSMPFIAEKIMERWSDLDGEGARFLRKFMGLTQEQLAARLLVSRDTILRWEKSADILPGPEALALVTLVRRQRVQRVTEHLLSLIKGSFDDLASGLMAIGLTPEELRQLRAVLVANEDPPPARIPPGQPRVQLRISAPMVDMDSTPPPSGV